MRRIAIDATGVSARPTGAARVVKSLVANLPTVDPGTEYVALATEEGARMLAEVAPAARAVVVPPSSGVRWELSGAAAASRAAGAGLLFTVRELIGARVPPTLLHVFEPPAYRLRAGLPTRSGAKDRLLAMLFRRTVGRAAAVTAGSATTAAWLREHYGVEATVILPGLAPEFFDAATRPEVQPDPYLFCLATGDPREENDVVLAALAESGRQLPRLVVAGSAAPELGARAAAVGVAERVEVRGWVSDSELRSLFRGAVAFIHSTRYEAYGGLPALEAFALGAPVVAFEAPGVTEALAGAALLVERVDPKLLAEALRTVASDSALRRQLVEAGRERVDPLRSERVARELAAVFRRVLP